MADYNKPPLNNISFTFSSAGYSPPEFSDLDFTYNLRDLNTSVSNLKASIEVMQLYQDSTYTYVKECKTVVVGFSTAGVQVLKLPCLYGGIRDLGSFIYGNLTFTDLQVDITALFNFLNLGTRMYFSKRESLDFYSLVRPNWASQADLMSWFRFALHRNKDLSGYMKFFKGKQIPVDLYSWLNTVQPIDMQAYLNIIEIRNIKASILGELWKSSSDISTNFYRFFFRANKDLKSFLMGWATFDLNARITSFWTTDLKAKLTAGYFDIIKDILVDIYAVSPKNLISFLHGYDYLDLDSSIISDYGPSDLQIYITECILPKNLKAFIKVFEEIEVVKDLKAWIEGYYLKDLYSYIQPISYVSLKAFIDAVGKYKDLVAEIQPKTINIQQLLFIPLFEHKDLYATVGFSCLKSAYLDLPIQMHILGKLDLKAYIIGWWKNWAGNVKDLSAYININNITTINTYTIQGRIQEPKYTNLKIRPDNKLYQYKTFDEFALIGRFFAKDLLCYIYAQPQNLDLKTYINAVPIANFTTVPSWIKPDNRVVVLNLRRFEERWYRFVDLMFTTNSQDDYYYFYVAGTNQAYKVDKNRTWKIEVTGYEPTDNIFKRQRVIQKYLFDIRKFKTFDDALRDLIDRVTELRKKDLKVKITTKEHPNSILKATLNSVVIHKWLKNLNTQLKCLVRDNSLISTTIQPELFKAENNLTITIVGKGYEPQLANDVKFVFDESGYTTQEPYSNINWTYTQAEEFWKE
jgi:hypothetical protein